MQLKIYVVSGIINFLYLILRRILLWIYTKPPSIPISTTPSLFALSATTLARKIRQREITSYYVIKEYIKEIKNVNPYLNAVIDNCFEDAVVQAKICDEELKAGKFNVETLEKEKPLYGVPFTVKESCSVKGCSYTGGSLGRKGMIAANDGEAIAALRYAGGIPLCVTNTPEMCGGFECSNLLFGRTLNPYDTRFTPGGSSGGEGALIGAGVSLIGIGSDLGGSIRFPAFCNGVFGFKPTSRIVSSVGHMPCSEDEFFLNYLSIGPITRYAEDLGLIMKVLTAKCDRPLHLDAPVDLKQLKIYYRQSMDDSFGLLPVEPEIKECVLKAAKHFTRYGNSVEQLPIEWPTTLFDIILAMFYNIKNWPLLVEDVNKPELKKNPVIELGKSFLGLSQHTSQLLFFDTIFQLSWLFSESELQHYRKQGKEIGEKLSTLLGQNGVFVYPTYRIAGVFPKIHIFEFLTCISYCAIFNILGFPAVNVPMGLNHDGLPLGIQVIAAPYQDRLCLAVAKELETAFGGWVPPINKASD